MTINEVQEEYQQQYHDSCFAYTEARDKAKSEGIEFDFDAFNLIAPKVNYFGLGKECVKAIQDEYGFSPKVAQYIYDCCYREKHSSFEEVFGYVSDVCELIKNLPKD